ncbi:MAG TPA: heavy metal translocating P-type ATPase metal-binding domain-containing protein [Saprospiraceae bacterium]|nr:heavy metal translocating P-type ATPase metal-binding domain-containing protein [Saprospiraceae bacterium]
MGINVKVGCYHCGQDCGLNTLVLGEKNFCCKGCLSVYQILNENDLCTYYDLNHTPGLRQDEAARSDKYLFLDSPEISAQIIQFQNGNRTHVSFYIPQIHCSSCLWLLEKLNTLIKGVLSTRVNFATKEVLVIFDPLQCSLRQLVETLDAIGYAPHLSLHELSHQKLPSVNKSLIYKLGVAGFAFANIMMMSIAQYFGKGAGMESSIFKALTYISLVVSLPVVFYSASEFYNSAFQSLKKKYINIDLPISIAILITFLRSLVEIYLQQGSGYLDSMAGIVFFMLIGRWAQSKTSTIIHFDRDFNSFFPIALNVIKSDTQVATPISKVKKNDIFQIYNNEFIPLDAMLSKGEAMIDYSFVSGESLPVKVKIGEIIYAGGRQTGEKIELVAIKEFSQNYITNLWNHSVFNRKKSEGKDTYDTIANYFTATVLVIGVIAGFYWYSQSEMHKMWNSITTVLIVACPCALLLSKQFTYGNVLRLFNNLKLYLRSSDVIYDLSKINSIVLDKTGTITEKQFTVKYHGATLTQDVKINLVSLFSQSSHPYSRAIIEFLSIRNSKSILNFKEIVGSGIEAWIDDQYYKLGSPSFVGHQFDQKFLKGSIVCVIIDQESIGHFQLETAIREFFPELVHKLKSSFKLHILSGDHSKSAEKIQLLFGENVPVLLEQKPEDKLKYIKQLQEEKDQNVAMIGDGLNDAAALMQSEVGIALVEGNNSFTPKCDAVLEAGSLQYLPYFIKMSGTAKKIIVAVFAFAVIYNIVGLYFAVIGELEPVIAAILMPLSSLTIIFLTYVLSNIMSSHYLKSYPSKSI